MGNILYRNLHLYILYVSNGNHKSINHGKCTLFFVVLFCLYRSNRSFKQVIGMRRKRKSEESEIFSIGVVITLILVVTSTEHCGR